MSGASALAAFLGLGGDPSAAEDGGGAGAGAAPLLLWLR